MSSVPKTVLGESGLSDSVLNDSALAEAAIGLASDAPSVLAWPRISQRVRAWLLTAVLFLVPLVAYWPATFHQYGLRDDYSNLREAHEEVGKVLQFCASACAPDLRLAFAGDLRHRPHRCRICSGCAWSQRCFSAPYLW